MQKDKLEGTEVTIKLDPLLFSCNRNIDTVELMQKMSVLISTCCAI